MIRALSTIDGTAPASDMRSFAPSRMVWRAHDEESWCCMTDCGSFEERM
jgi:hypothetical protein